VFNKKAGMQDLPAFCDGVSHENNPLTVFGLGKQLLIGFPVMIDVRPVLSPEEAADQQKQEQVVDLTWFEHGVCPGFVFKLFIAEARTSILTRTAGIFWQANL
jgi:hypothetical protein